jgi:hypothetical protein
MLQHWKKWGFSTQELISEILPVVKELMEKDRDFLRRLVVDSSQRAGVETRGAVSQAQVTIVDAIVKALEDFSYGQSLANPSTGDAITNVPHLLERVLEIVENVQEDIRGRSGAFLAGSY